MTATVSPRTSTANSRFLPAMIWDLTLAVGALSAKSGSEGQATTPLRPTPRRR